MNRKLFIALILLLGSSHAVAAPQDRIIRKNGPALTGIKILSEDYKTIKYEVVGGGERSIKSNQVVDVYRGSSPTAFRDGRSACRSGDFRNAVNLLTLAAGNTKAGDWIQEYANFWLGEAQRRSGNHREAISAYKKVMSAKADSRLMPASSLGIIRAHLAAGNYSAAQSAAGEFRREVSSRRLDTAFGIEAQLLEAECFRGQKRWVEAAGAYGRVDTAARNAASKEKEQSEKKALLNLAVEAAWNQGFCLVEAKDYNQASSKFGLLERQGNETPRARAVGLLGAGLVELRRGNLDAARLSLTRMIATEVAAEQELPRAYLYLGETYVALAQKGEKSAKRYAAGYLQDLTKNFAGTPEAIAARDLLQKLK